MPTVFLNPRGNIDPAQGEGGWQAVETRPRYQSAMTQQFFGATNVFYFPASPVEVQFEAMAAAFEEVPRAGNYPLVIFTGLPLVKASIQFRLFDRATGGQADISGTMQQLQRMATLPAPVVFYGVDQMMMKPGAAIDLGLGYRREFVMWRITDLSMKVLRRNLDNNATQADVTISFQEDRNPTIPFVTLPRITYANIPQRGGSTKTNGAGKTYNGVSQDNGIPTTQAKVPPVQT
jgi:hypothetical protein